MELSRGIHMIDGVNAHSYLAIEDEGTAIIDTGSPGCEKKIIAYCKSVGVEPGKIRYIILTHPDIDHSGSVAKLKALTEAKVAIHEADAPRLSGEKKLKEVKNATGALLFGVLGRIMRFTPVQPDVLLKDSDRLLDLVVVHAPGHTDGSICLYKEKDAIFVGDALRTNSAGKLRLPPGAMSVNMEQVKESVRRISTLQYALLLPGHGPPVTEDASGAVASFVQAGFA